MKVFELEWQHGFNSILWRCGEVHMSKTYRLPLQSVCLLMEKDGIAVVESFVDAGPRNAAILDCDGTERLRLSLPMRDEVVRCYDSIYFVKGMLTAILVTTSGDFAVIVDPETGKLSGLRETR